LGVYFYKVEVIGAANPAATDASTDAEQKKKLVDLVNEHIIDQLQTKFTELKDLVDTLSTQFETYSSEKTESQSKSRRSIFKTSSKYNYYNNL